MRKHLLILILLTLFMNAKNFTTIKFTGDVDLITGEFDRATLLKICHIEYPPIYKVWKKDPIFETAQIEDFIENLTNYAQSMGYYKVKVNSKTTDDTIILDIQKHKAIKINSIHMNEEYQKLALVKQGTRFRTSDFTQTKKKITRQLEEQGYPNYSMNAKAFVDIDLYQVDINITIKKGQKYYFSTTDINNTSGINSELIREQIVYKEGELYNIEKIEKSYDNLYRLGVFSKIDMDTNNSQGKTPISIYLEEGDTKEITSYLGYDTQDGIRSGVEYIDHSFLGDLRDLKVGAQMAQEGHRVYSTVYDPRIIVPILGKFNFKNEVGYENWDYDGFDEKLTIERATFGKEFFKLEHFFGFQLEYSDIDSDNPIFLDDNYLINSLFYKLLIDERDSEMDAKNGYYASLYIEKAMVDLGSDIDYLKLLAEVRYIKEIAPFVVAVKIEAGMLSQETPLFKHFYAGGAMSNRGYEYRDLGSHESGDAIGGVGVIDISIEGRYYLTKNFAVVGFMDATTLSEEVKEFNSEWYRSYGTGLRYLSVIGPLRFDIGLQEHGDFAIHLGIGQVF